MNYKITLANGYMAIVEAVSLADARNYAYKQQGTDNVVSIREAAGEDVSWCKGMGGMIHVTDKAYAKRMKKK